MSVMIDGGKLIERQLAAVSPEEVLVADGVKTPLVPVRYTPALSNSSMTMSLDGAWRVKRWPFPADEAMLASSVTPDDDWEERIQPGKIFYGDPDAENAPIPNWDRVTLSHINPEDGAVIRRQVCLPALWAGKRIHLRFDSIYPAGRIYLNGKLLGDHRSGLTPVEYDVTDCVIPGEPALVAVRLLRRHKFVQMDMPRHALEFAGLAQSACFFATEQCQISDYHLSAELDSALTTGTLAGKVILRNHGTTAVNGKIRLTLLDQLQESVRRNPPRLSATPPKEGSFHTKGRSACGCVVAERTSEAKGFDPLLGGVRPDSQEVGTGGGSESDRKKLLQANLMYNNFKVLPGSNDFPAAVVIKDVVLEAGTSVEVQLSLIIKNPKLWNDEFPNLYQTRLELEIFPQPCGCVCGDGTTSSRLSATGGCVSGALRPGGPGRAWAGRPSPIKTEALQPDIPGQPLQSIVFNTGFRRFELSPAGPKLNGHFIKFRGVNHLTFHPEGGLHTPRAWLKRDLQLMKKANVNAIRTHFLGPRYLADLCDELGIYLLQELPIDWGTHYIHNPEWIGPALMRIEGGIRRDRHHPSVMVWSVGNENMPESKSVIETGWNILRTYDRFCKRLDPSRPTMFPPPGPANKIDGIFEVRVGDIADTHYSFNLQKEFRRTGKMINPRSWDADMEEMTREQALARGWSGVWFSSEYGIFNGLPDLINAPYLSLICDRKPKDILNGENSLQVFTERLRDEWGNMRDDPTCLGGAYFPWLCCGAGKGPEGNPWGWVRWGEDADWGVITADLLPKPFFWALRVLFSPVWFPSRVAWKKGADSFAVTLTNQYNAIDLKDCILRTQQNAGGEWMSVVRQYQDVAVKCPPGGTVNLEVPIWHDGMKKALEKGGFGYCRFSLMDPNGFRPIMADVLVMPEEMIARLDNAMPVGPDAVM